jgi:carbon-monoxide dehydrogenase medium subunit
VKPAAFAYHAASSTEEALALLEQYGSEAKALAGGQSLIPAMNFRLATPAALIDLNRIGALAFVRADDHGLHLGGMTRHRTLERNADVAAGAPLVAAAMPYVAHAAIRTRGTIGGSLAHADPAAELPAVMLALDASFTLQSRTASRTVPAAEFFQGLFLTALAPGELLVGITIPRAAGASASAFDEVSRRHGDFALAGAAAHVAVNGDGVCTVARVGLFGLADRPVLAGQVTRTLAGVKPSREAIRAAADASARDDVDPSSDIHASSGYRRHLAAVLIRRVLERAFFSLENA